MPTLAEQEELLNDCIWTTLNGVNGYCVTGPNGNTIFLPATGYYYDVETIYGKGNDGGFWSNALAADYNSRAYEMSFYIKSYFHNYKTLRYYGMTVRPVCGEGVTPVFQSSVSLSCAGGGVVAIQ